MPQRIQQRPQPVVVHLLHQRQQAADFTFGKAFASEPVQVVAGQVGQQATRVFAERHLDGDEFFKVFGLHDVAVCSTTGAFHRVALLLQRGHHGVAMVALHLDHAVFHGAARAALGFELFAQLG